MYMLDQSFSANNLRKIFDLENRKGHYLEGRFFSEEISSKIEEITRELKECHSGYKDLKKNKDSLLSQEYETQRITLNKKKEELVDEKEKLLTATLEKISKEITDNSFKITLKIQNKLTKVVYATEKKDAATYFALKQVQYNIKKLYQVKQSNRYNILCQLKNLLNDKFPKYVILTDIKDFFETIPGDKIEQKINYDHLLTTSSKKIIKQILSEYTRLSGDKNGIPRGVGISSYLAELYMRSIDDEIRSQKDVIYYARYVDDIIVIYAPQPNSDISNLGQELTNIISNDSGLTVHKDKTELIDLMNPKNCTLEYLGYKIEFGTGTVKLELTESKIKKYESRLSKSFTAYHKTSKFNEQKARKLLIKRIRFLTSNTRLLNNKKNTVVGVYFSNSLLDCSTNFTGLDNYLKGEISKISPDALKTRLSKLSFIEGFSQQRYARFTSAELEKITRVWKYVS